MLLLWMLLLYALLLVAAFVVVVRERAPSAAAAPADAARDAALSKANAIGGLDTADRHDDLKREVLADLRKELRAEQAAWRAKLMAGPGDPHDGFGPDSDQAKLAQSRGAVR